MGSAGILISSALCLNVYLDCIPFAIKILISSLHKICDLLHHFDTIHACIFKIFLELFDRFFIQKVLAILYNTYLVELYHFALSRNLFFFRLSQLGMLWLHIQSILHALDFLAAAQLLQLICVHFFNYLIEPLGSNRCSVCLIHDRATQVFFFGLLELSFAFLQAEFSV